MILTEALVWRDDWRIDNPFDGPSELTLGQQKAGDY